MSSIVPLSWRRSGTSRFSSCSSGLTARAWSADHQSQKMHSIIPDQLGSVLSENWARHACEASARYRVRQQLRPDYGSTNMLRLALASNAQVACDYAGS
jgi:hypothetical protein